MFIRVKYFLVVFVLCLVACKSDKKYHDEKKEVVKVKTSIDTTDKIASVLDFQNKMNEEFKNAETSPLTDMDRSKFESLDFFAIDTGYVVKAKLTFTPEARSFLMPTTTERKTEEVLYAIARFEIKGAPFQLNIYQSVALLQEEEYKDYLFLPFSDLTNGNDTYGGGRYIDLRIPDGNEITIDFNKAYNPYCAYNKKYSCPLVPAENMLNTRIEAGVKKFK